MSDVRVLIVDDEPLARRGLRRMVEQCDGFAVSGECGSGRDAIRAIRESDPDLVLLDIDMPEVDGFEVIRRVGPDAMPLVVFASAHAGFGPEAFDVAAADYVLKPVGLDRLRGALERAARRLDAEAAMEREALLRALLAASGRSAEPGAATAGRGRSRGGASLRRIPVAAGESVRLLNPERVDWIESAGNYVAVHSQGRRYLARRTLASLEAELSPHGFVRIRRSTLINGSAVAHLTPDGSGRWSIVMRDGASHTSSRRRKREVMRLLDGEL